MQINKSRDDFKEYILEQLGAGIIQINVTDKQVDNAVNQAFKTFWLKHHDGTFENFYAIPVTDQMVTDGFLLLPPDVEAVTEVLPQGFSPDSMNFANFEWQLTAAAMASAGGMTTGMFSAPGQGPGGSFNGNSYVDVRGNYSQISLADFYLARQQIDYLRDMTGANIRPYSYARHLRRLTPHFGIKAGQFVVLRAWENVNPESDDATKAAAAIYVWDDPWLIEYATAQVKKTWASVLKKFGSIELPGGVLLDGQTMYEEATSDILRLEDDLLDANPPFFLVG